MEPSSIQIEVIPGEIGFVTTSLEEFSHRVFSDVPFPVVTVSVFDVVGNLVDVTSDLIVVHARLLHNGSYMEGMNGSWTMPVTDGYAVFDDLIFSFFSRLETFLEFGISVNGMTTNSSTRVEVILLAGLPTKLSLVNRDSLPRSIVVGSLISPFPILELFDGSDQPVANVDGQVTVQVLVETGAVSGGVSEIQSDDFVTFSRLSLIATRGQNHTFIFTTTNTSDYSLAPAQWTTQMNACPPAQVGSEDCFCEEGYEGEGGVITNPVFCKPCPIGKYNPMVGSSCLECPGETTTLNLASTDASECVCAGEQEVFLRGSNEGRCGCIAGYERTDEGCSLCPVGTYKTIADDSNGSVALSCIPCPGQKSTATSGTTNASECVCQSYGSIHNEQTGECLCPPGLGFFRSGDCESCPIGWYKTDAINLQCTICPESRTTLTTGSQSLSACICETNFYDSGDSCSSCPRGGICPLGSNRTTMQSAPGFSRLSTESVVFYECMGCEGDGVCSEGREGTLCSQCAEGYGGTECSPCLSVAVNWLLLSLLLIFIILVSVHAISTTTNIKHSKNGVLKTIFNYGQGMIFVAAIEFHWPKSLTKFTGFVAGVGLRFDIAPIDCLFGWDYYQYLLAYLIILSVGIGIWVLLLAIYFITKKKEGSMELGKWFRSLRDSIPWLAKSETKDIKNWVETSDAWDPQQTKLRRQMTLVSKFDLLASTTSTPSNTPSKESSMLDVQDVKAPEINLTKPHKALDTFITVLIMFVFVTHPIVTKQLLEVLNCKEFVIEDTQVSLLSIDPSLPCSGEQYFLYRRLSIAFLAMYSVGFPLIGFFILYCKKAKLHSPNNQRKFRFLYYSFTYRAFYWEFVIMLRKWMFAVVVVFGGSVVLRGHGLLWVICIYIALHLMFLPFALPVGSAIELGGQGLTVLTVLTGLISTENAQVYFVTGEYLVSEGWLFFLVTGVLILNMGFLLLALSLAIFGSKLNTFVIYFAETDRSYLFWLLPIVERVFTWYIPVVEYDALQLLDRIDSLNTAGAGQVVEPWDESHNEMVTGFPRSQMEMSEIHEQDPNMAQAVRTLRGAANGTRRRAHTMSFHETPFHAQVYHLNKLGITRNFESLKSFLKVY
eukprot:Lithocolla_globosa_v1_NODE_5_length_12010_cov_23.451945.p1 type:complete len:1114 gc:universal NODE_5_length_12010_cov_23.451945:3369-28(-)